MHVTARLLVTPALLVLLAACGAEEPADGPAPEPSTPTTLLQWTPTGGGPEDRRTVGAEWSVLVDRQGRTATLTGPDRVTVTPRSGRVVSQVAMDDGFAVVAEESPDGRGAPAATVVDLADGSTYPVSDPPAGESWTLHDETLRYATFDADDDYCLVEADAGTAKGDFVHCAAARHGITRITTGDHGTAFLDFDDRRPISCRTPMLLTTDGAIPVEEAADCSSWDVAAMPGGAVWSEVRNERRPDEGVFRAVVDGTTHDLGAGTTGTLTPCGDSAYFARDPVGRDDRAQLLRWTPEATLEVVFESRSRGNAFLAPPECAGDVLTVSSFGPGGDEQVWASVP